MDKHKRNLTCQQVVWSCSASAGRTTYVLPVKGAATNWLHSAAWWSPAKQEWGQRLQQAYVVYTAVAIANVISGQCSDLETAWTWRRNSLCSVIYLSCSKQPEAFVATPPRRQVAFVICFMTWFVLFVRLFSLAKTIPISEEIVPAANGTNNETNGNEVKKCAWHFCCVCMRTLSVWRLHVRYLGRRHREHI